MPVTTPRRESTHVTATVSVRVPRDADGDLATDAQRRLRAVGAVQDATVDGLRTIEPQLSATVVTVVAELETEDPVADLREELSATVGVESVEGLERQ